MSLSRSWFMLLSRSVWSRIRAASVPLSCPLSVALRFGFGYSRVRFNSLFCRVLPAPARCSFRGCSVRRTAPVPALRTPAFPLSSSARTSGRIFCALLALAEKSFFGRWRVCRGENGRPSSLARRVAFSQPTLILAMEAGLGVGVARSLYDAYYAISE